MTKKEDLDLEEKRRLAKELLAQRQQKISSPPDYKTYTYDMFMHSMGARPVEMERFSQWVDQAVEDGVYAFESERLGAQTTSVDLLRETGETMHLLNFSSYNYLGFGYHPDVIQAAQDAVAKFGLGANSSPVISGTYQIHKQFERALLDFFGLEGKGVSLFSSGYGVNLGVLQAFANPGSHILLDRSSHMSLLEGAKLAGAQISYFNHNSPDHLEEVLQSLQIKNQRVLICVEGIYSADGDFGKLDQIIEVAKRHNAFVLVDEAHSGFVAGENGKGTSEKMGVLEEIDFLVLTFSKALSGVGGCVIADQELTRYINWYAKCRFFSCALDPAVTGGMLKVVELLSGHEGYNRRQRIKENADYFRARLKEFVNIGKSESWIVTVLYGNDKLSMDLNNYLQHQGLDSSPLQFPAAPKNEGRLRLFVTSEHTRDQIDQAVLILVEAARKFNFEIAAD